ncbi:hypothetical protein ES319_D09G089400v1 [Gossypium barbadense]|uniref:Uncharacterized protein n=2 Tax=Gossypium TaxID=3633 RepID=A0A5J5Q5V7_GOSBA|nr:hypothetical protein ES319_D09G089400v1 [Gossypium barbadense]TYG53357.1 hypothetical protein ES288_D09G103400v1 [Gossypium darwinii]
MVTISISPVAAQSLYIRNARNVPFIPLRNSPFRATTKLSTLAHSSGSISFSPLRFLIKDKEIKKKKKSRGSSAVCYAAPLSRLNLQWISVISSAVLFFTKGTVIRKQFLVPLIAIQAPTSIISWMKGEYGIWAAFLGLLVRLFFFIPGEHNKALSFPW